MRPAGEAALSTFSIDVDTASYAQRAALPRPRSTGSRRRTRCGSRRWSTTSATTTRARADGDPVRRPSMDAAAAPWEPRAPARPDRPQGPRGRRRRSAAPRTSSSSSTSPARWTTPSKLPLVKRSIALLVEQLRERGPRGDRRLRRRLRPRAAAAPPAIAGPRSSPRSRSSRPAAPPTAARASSSPTAWPRSTSSRGGVNRVILATDGDFNVGVTNQARPRRTSSRRRRRAASSSPCSASASGNLKDSTMEKLADKGNGNYAYIDSHRRGAEGARRARPAARS